MSVGEAMKMVISGGVIVPPMSADTLASLKRDLSSM
jgi:uncharacterized membrane protein